MTASGGCRDKEATMDSNPRRADVEATALANDHPDPQITAIIKFLLNIFKGLI